MDTFRKCVTQIGAIGRMGGKGLRLVFPDSPEKYAPNSLGVALIIVLLASVAFGVLEWYIVYYAFLSCSMLSANIVIALISLGHHHAYPHKTGAG